MKKIFLLTLSLSTAILAGASPARSGSTSSIYTNPHSTVEASSHLDSRGTVIRHIESETSDVKGQQAQSRFGAEPELVPVTVTVTYRQYVDFEPGNDFNMSIIGDNYYDFLWFEECDIPIDEEATIRTVSNEVMVPAEGAWIVLNQTGNVGHWGTVVMIKHIDPSESTELTFNAEEASYLMKIRLKDQDGKVVKLTQGHFDETGKPIVSYVSDITEVMYYTKLIFRGYTIVGRTTSTDYTLDSDNPAGADFWDVWTNYLGDDFLNLFSSTYYKGDKELWTTGYGSLYFTEENLLSYNDPSDYISLTKPVDHSPVYDLPDYYPANYGIIGVNNLSKYGWEHTRYLGKMAGSPLFAPYRQESEDYTAALSYGLLEWENMGMLGMTISPNYISQGAGEYVICPYAYAYYLTNQGAIPESTLLRFAPDKIGAPFGVGPMFLAMELGSYPYWEDETINIPWVEGSTLGLVGDLRQYNAQLMKWTISADGTELCREGDMGTMYDVLMNNAISRPDTKEYVFETGCTNQQFGDKTVDTRSISTVKYDNNETWMPSITAVHAINSRGELTYDLDTADDATLVVAGVSRTLNPYADAYTDPYKYRPVTLTVEYAVSGSGEWQTLEVQAQGEGLIDGVGSMGTVDLSGIDTVSPEGYFDLRVSVTDELGSSHVNTISPALRIASLSGVEALKGDGAQIEAIYNLQGVRLAAPAPGLNIVRYTDGSTRKIFLPF